MWRKVLREYFAFPKKERQGLFVLILIWFALFIYRYYRSENYRYAEWDTILQTDTLIRHQVIRINNKPVNIPEIKKPVPANLASVSFKQLMDLGISQRSSAIIISLIRKGYKFDGREQIERLYGLSAEEKDILLHSFTFSQPEVENITTEPVKKQISKIKIINLNACDSFELEALPRIGLRLSSRIIKYRDKLGGFVNTNQLYEVYGLDSDAVALIQPYLLIDTALVSKIDINKADYKELQSFPYIGRTLASVIVNYRTQHGNFNSLNDIKKIRLIKTNDIAKLEPYIKFNDD